MPKRKVPESTDSAATPRKFLGGKAKKTKRNEGSRVNADRWTELAARKAAAAFQAVRARSPEVSSIEEMFHKILTTDKYFFMFEHELDAIAREPERLCAREVFQHHRKRCMDTSANWTRLPRMRSKLRAAYGNMLQRAKRAGEMGDFEIERRPPGATPLEALFLFDEDRELPEEGRILTALARWDWSAFTGTAFLVFERAQGRLVDQFPDEAERPCAATVERLLHRDELPTALASSGDHFLILEARTGGGMPHVRYMSVADNAAAAGVPEFSVLRDALAAGPPTITATQAVEALGEGIHGLPVQAIIEALEAEGSWPKDDVVTLGTAFSGVGTDIAVVDDVECGQIRVAFASEPRAERRRVLLQAWAARGLTEEHLYMDARDPRARREERVGVYIITPICQPFSPRNHTEREQQRLDQARALADVHAALDYVRWRRPPVVIVENVDVPALREHMDMLLLGIGSHRWRSVVIDPRDVGGFTARKRRFWIGVALESDDAESDSE